MKADTDLLRDARDMAVAYRDLMAQRHSASASVEAMEAARSTEDLIARIDAALGGATDTKLHVNINADTSAFTAVIDELSAFVEVAQLAPESRDLIARFVESGKELVRFDDAMAAGEGERLVRAQPGDRLLRLLAAFRAGNADHGVIAECLGHGASRADATATQTMAERP